jgi:hypothetical protein
VFSEQVHEQIRQELANAVQAREQGYEGRARVCARRAAGAAIREYFRLRGNLNRTGSAIDLIQMLAAYESAPTRARMVAAALLERVDENFSLPPQVDLIFEVNELARVLEEHASQTKEG